MKQKYKEAIKRLSRYGYEVGYYSVFFESYKENDYNLWGDKTVQYEINECIKEYNFKTELSELLKKYDAVIEPYDNGMTIELNDVEIYKNNSWYINCKNILE